MPRSSVLTPFRNSSFRALWTATLASNLGGLVQAVGAGWLMVSLTPSHGMVALVQSSNTLPIMAFSLIAGALADNFNRRRIMIFAQVFMLLVSAALALCSWFGLLTPWLLLAFTFLIGSGTALFNPSWQASMGDIVAREDLPNAVSLNSMGFNMMRSLGPAIGGLIVAAAGAAAAFALNAFSYLPLIGALIRWKPAYPKSSLPPEPLGAALGAGLRYIMMSPALLRVMGRGAVFGFAAVSVLALLPVVARDTLQGSALTYGILLGCFGLGAIGGVALNGPLRERLTNEVVVRLAFAGFALSMTVLAFSTLMLTSCAALLLAGACWVLALSLFNVTVQLATPRWVVGRALSFYQTAVFGGMAVGAWSWGALADGQGVSFALCTSAAMLLIGLLLGFWLWLPEFSTLDLAPLDRFRAPEPVLDIKARSGPIMVMIDYIIDPGDTDAFLRLMQERRRIRIRDGARQWALLRDMENPRQWMESYHVPTWLDYLRHNHRRTKADAENYDSLRALHRGIDDRPRVHRMIERQTVPVHDDIPPRQTTPEIPGV
ncbi:MFS transporter [Sinirhodobacter populi]|uniref:MFS transporter n=1 Tax=Paenirhodobacter populi TaxID=2306993 RepID=A0A443K6G5_9RHOB|nr:MFS transporter [Sinirhodobacter populi]RWR28335.1 MFS transporter [Sinirhodobacter populi]